MDPKKRVKCLKEAGLSKKKNLFMKNPGKKIYQSLRRNFIELILSILFKEKMIFLKYEKDKLFFISGAKGKT